MNQNCSKSKCIVYTISIILLPLVIIAAIVNFAPPQVARIFINPDKVQSVFQYQQVKKQEQLQKDFKKKIKKDIKEGENGNLLGNKMDPVIGNPNAKVAIVEYLDYKCGFCKKAHMELSRVLSDVKYKDSVRLVVKHRPVVGGEVSLYASEVAIAFYQKHPEKFGELHSKLFASSLNSKADVDAVLKSFGTSYKQIATDKARDSLIANFNFAREEISGIPAFIIGEDLFVGFRSSEELAQAIDAQLKK